MNIELIRMLIDPCPNSQILESIHPYDYDISSNLVYLSGIGLEWWILDELRE